MTDLHHIGTKRPQFLKILCILSFIMCGLMILSSIFSIVFSLLAGNIGLEGAEKSSALDQVLNYAANSWVNSVKELVVQLIALTGVFLMWKLIKWGFLIYMLAEIFMYFEFLYVATTMNIGAQEFKGAGFELFWPIPFDLAFIIMYATQLKFMSWKRKTVPAFT